MRFILLTLKLGEYAGQLLLSERLARLRVDVPLAAGPRFLALTSEAVERTRRLFEQLEFKSLLRRLETLAALEATFSTARVS